MLLWVTKLSLILEEGHVVRKECLQAKELLFTETKDWEWQQQKELTTA